MAELEVPRTLGARTSAKAGSPWQLQDHFERPLVSAEEQPESPPTAEEAAEEELDVEPEERPARAVTHR